MRRVTTSLAVLILLAAVLASAAQADFILWNDEQITVDSEHQEGNLYDTSRADIVAGGEVHELYAHDLSTVDVSGGSMGWPSHAYNQSTVTMSSGTMASLWTHNDSSVEVSGGTVTGSLRSYDESAVDISDGSVKDLYAEDFSTLDMSGGSVDHLTAYDSNTLDISGGSMRLLQILRDTTLNMSGGTIEVGLHTYGSSIATFNVRDFRLGGGLSLDGNRILGTGILSGQWMNDTEHWTIDIATNSGAGIFISLVVVGDANIDGVVDVADLGILATNYGQGGGFGWGDGDFNGDGFVDVSDLGDLATNYDNGSAAGASVPEPGIITLLLCGLAGLALLRRR